MSAFPWGRLPAALFALALLSATRSAQAEDFTFFHENVMGTSFELRAGADTAEAAAWAEGRILREIDRLTAIFSSYDSQSEFSRWQATSGVAVKLSPELFEVLKTSDDWAERSRGAFDPRVEALTQLWSKCSKQGRVPTSAEQSETKTLMSQPAWRLDSKAQTAEHTSRCPLSLNAIAKGFIIDSACRVALDRDRGIQGLVLNIGGDLLIRGKMVQRVAIANPRRDSESAEPLAHVDIKNRAVATSGNSQRGFRVGPISYSHLFDPQTGHPVEAIISATVIADRAETADALATIFNVLPVDESLRLANALPDVECLLVEANGKISRSRGWPPDAAPAAARDLLVAVAGSDPQPSPSGEAKTSPASLWNEAFELQVSFELQGPAGTPGRYRRPFVAVWVEDKQGKSVRTLVLWAQKNARSQWVPDLRRWYRGDQARRTVDDLDLRKVLSRATRPPGKYDVVWDGKDDHGRLVPSGEYTVNIEAVREHGTYQVIRRRVTLANQPFAEDLKGNVEVKSASLTYRRSGQGR